MNCPNPATEQEVAPDPKGPHTEVPSQPRPRTEPGLEAGSSAVDLEFPDVVRESSSSPLPGLGRRVSTLDWGLVGDRTV